MKDEAIRLHSQHAPDDHVGRFALKCESEPYFFGFSMRVFAEVRFGGRMAGLADWLGATEEQMLRLRMCRWPGKHPTAVVDLEADCRLLADHVGLPVERIREIATSSAQ